MQGVQFWYEGRVTQMEVSVPFHLHNCIHASPIGNVLKEHWSTYERVALVPTGDWQSISLSPLDAADAKVSVFPANSSAIITVANYISNCSDQNEVEQRLYSAFGIMNSLFESVSLAIKSPEEARVLGVSAGASGLLTATIDPRISRRIGLHVDDWDRKNDEKRGNARLRLCINLGTETRFLLIVPIALHVAAHWKASLGLMNVKGSDFGRELIHRLKPPVIRIPIPPLYAYLAATENLIHDASTASMSSVDLAWTVLGHFNDRVLPEALAGV